MMLFKHRFNSQKKYSENIPKMFPSLCSQNVPQILSEGKVCGTMEKTPFLRLTLESLSLLMNY